VLNLHAGVRKLKKYDGDLILNKGARGKGKRHPRKEVRGVAKDILASSDNSGKARKKTWFLLWVGDSRNRRGGVPTLCSDAPGQADVTVS